MIRGLRVLTIVQSHRYTVRAFLGGFDTFASWTSATSVTSTAGHDQLETLYRIVATVSLRNQAKSTLSAAAILTHYHAPSGISDTLSPLAASSSSDTLVSVF